MERYNPFYRGRLTPWALKKIIEYPEIAFGNFINDVFTPGVVSGAFPRASILGGWDLSIDELVAYSKSGQRIFVDRSGDLSIWHQGDFLPEEIRSAHDNYGGQSDIEIKPLEIPGDGKERWVSVGVLPYYYDMIKGVDGYGETQALSKKLTFRFRVVHGETGEQGRTYKPSKEYFRTGALLCDIQIVAGQSGITDACIYYDRADIFSAKNLPLYVGGGFSSVPAQKLAFRGGGFPGVIQATETGDWFDRFSFHPSLCRRLTIIRSEVKSLLAGSGETIIEIDKALGFGSGAKISVRLSAADKYARSDEQLTITPISGEDIFVRCSAGGGHSEVRWDIAFIPEYE